MSKPILQNILEKRKNVLKEFWTFDSILIKRITYILQQISKVCTFSFDDWYVTGAPDENFGDVGSLLYHNTIRSELIILEGMEGKWYTPHSIIIIKGKEWNLRNKIPQRWLFENFEQELIDSRQAYITMQQHKDAMLNIARESVKAKLSAQELKVLGL